MTKLRAILFDLDGVLTPTAEVHRRAWAQLFEPWCVTHGVAAYTDADYFECIDGKPRFEGVAALVASRGVEVPWGHPDDPPSSETIYGLGHRKNEVVHQILAQDGVAPYPGSMAFLTEAISHGFEVAVVSSSRNAPMVLAAAKIAELFPIVVDGQLAERVGLPGKPAPDTYRHAAQLLGVLPAEAVVVEDAVSGVQAGRAGGFGLVIGVDRGVGAESLLAQGADLVVADLAELTVANLQAARGA